jgi:hypothetical protein
MSDEPEFDPDADTFDPEFYRTGGVNLPQSVLDSLGEIRDFEVLVSPEGTLEEAFSLANLGANVTVLGHLSAESSELIERSGIDVATEGGRLGHRPTSLASGSFDLIFSPWGSLDGMADFEAWSADVADLLKPDGHLMAFDEHPVSFIVRGQGTELVVKSAYWGEYEDNDNDGVESELDSYSGWAIGDLVSSLGEVGLATLSLEEFADAGNYLTGLSLIEDVPVEKKALLPTALLLVARKLGSAVAPSTPPPPSSSAPKSDDAWSQ